MALPSITPSKPTLTSNDSAVLQALFDAESAPSPHSSTVQTDASLPPLPHIAPETLQTLQARELAAVKALNEESPSRDAIETAVADLSAIIDGNAEFASGYVNRAQALRMLIDLDISGENAQAHCATLLDDLAAAIALLTPPSSTQTSTQTTPVSPLTARILSNAHTHRAYLLYRASRSSSSPSPSSSSVLEVPELTILPPHLRRLSADSLEEMASVDFALGGRYGNPVAKQLAVHTNPYAKMCGAIVRDAMRAEIEEWMGTEKGEGEGV